MHVAVLARSFRFTTSHLFDSVHIIEDSNYIDMYTYATPELIAQSTTPSNHQKYHASVSVSSVSHRYWGAGDIRIELMDCPSVGDTSTNIPSLSFLKTLHAMVVVNAKLEIVNTA